MHVTGDLITLSQSLANPLNPLTLGPVHICVACWTRTILCIIYMNFCHRRVGCEPTQFARMADLLTRDHVTAPAADDMAEIASVVAAVTVAP